MPQKKHNDSIHFKIVRHFGFTIIELLVCIAVVAMLSMILMISLSTVRQKSLETESASVLRGYHSAFMLHVNEHGHLPGPIWTLQGPTYSSSSTYTASYLWKYFQDSEPQNGTIPDWMITRQYKDWYMDQSNKSGKLAYGFPESARTDDGRELNIFGYPDRAGSPTAAAQWLLLSSATNPSNVRIMYEVTATSGAPTRAPKRGEVQRHQAHLFLDGSIRLTDYK
jgi:prepilin-type N-terminal cleavage/methylation domain-containing protein